VPESIYIGVDVGGTKILSSVLKLGKDFKIIAKAKTKTNAHFGADQVFNRITENIRKSIKAAKINLEGIKAIGVGFPGTVDSKKGRVLVAPNLGWQDFPFQRKLQKIFEIPVLITNDVNAGTYGEQQYGSARGSQNIVGAFWGTGIGGGLICDGRLIEGVSFSAAEIGHMVMDENGSQCACGNRGCLETIVGKAAITQHIYERITKETPTYLPPKNELSGPLKSSQLLKAWQNGDRIVIDTIEEACKYLGMGLANIINLFNPDTVVLGGGVIEAMGDILLPKIDMRMRQSLFPSSKIKLKAAKLKDYSVVIGAAALARNLY